MTAEVVQQRRLSEIADLAEAVAAEYWTGGRTEPETIISAKRITLSFGMYADAFDGLLEHKSGKFHIYANLQRLKLRDSGRARFTLAHELGHFFIDDHRRALSSGQSPSHPSFTDHQSRNPVEQEADYFASHLLMPSGTFSAVAIKYPHGLDAVLGLKDQFGTSITSGAIRYTQLDLGPYALVKWNSTGFAWRWISPSAFAGGYRTTIRNPENIAQDSATGMALAGEAVPSKGFFQRGTLASAWCPGVRPGTTRDVLLIEQAIPLGEFGVLTLLIPEQAQILKR